MGRILDGYCIKIDPTGHTTGTQGGANEHSFDDRNASNFKLQCVSVRNAKCQNKEKMLEIKKKHVFQY